jgi:hypothetical protein
MSAIVIVSMPAPEGQLVTEQAAALRVVDPLPQSTESDNTRAELPEASNRDQMTPPFWTWFIENPRRCGA